MTVRMRSLGAKAGFLIAAMILGFLASLIVSVLLGVDAGMVFLVLAVVAIVVVTSRTFRGPGEPLAPPRPWWRMTATAVTSAVWAALFGATALSQIAGSWAGDEEAVATIVPVVYLIIAAAYTNSAIRQKGVLQQD